MQTKTHSTTLGIILISCFVVLFVFFIYTFLHEAGHALTGLLFGQSLTEFDVSFWDFSAHVELSGGDLTPSQLAIRAVAGASLPLLLWAIVMWRIPRRASFILEVFKLLSSMLVLNTLLVWIIIPAFYLFRKAPPADDVTHFLRYSQMQPLLLAVTALIIYLRGWAYFLSRINGLRNELLLFRTVDPELFSARTRKTTLVMIGMMAFCAVSAITLDLSAAKSTVDKFSPPSDFVSIAEIDLSQKAYSSEVLAEFTVDEPAYAGVFIEVHDINTAYFDLRLLGPDGYNSIVLHGEGYNAAQDGGLWEQNLLPGTYRVLLTSQQSPGTASVFLKTP